MQKSGNSSNIKIQMNNFTLNLQTLLAKQNQDLFATTQRKKSKTHRTKSNLQQLSPLKINKNKNQTINAQNKSKLAKQSVIYNKKSAHKNVNSKMNKLAKKESKYADEQNVPNQKSAKKSLEKTKNGRVNKLEQRFYEYDQVIQSARLTTSPSIYFKNHNFNSESISKSASRSRSKSYKKRQVQISRQNKSRSKSTFSTKNQRGNTYRSTDKMKQIRKKQNPQTQRSLERQKPRKSSQIKQRKSIDFQKRANKSKSRERIYTEQFQRNPLENKHFNSKTLNTDRLDLSHKKGKLQSNSQAVQNILASSESMGILGPKFTSNKFNQNQGQKKKQKKKSKQKQKKERKSSQAKLAKAQRITLFINQKNKAQKSSTNQNTRKDQKIKKAKNNKKQQSKPINNYEQKKNQRVSHNFYESLNGLTKVRGSNKKSQEECLNQLFTKKKTNKNERLKTENYTYQKLQRDRLEQYNRFQPDRLQQFKRQVSAFKKPDKNNNQQMEKPFKKKKNKDLIQQLFEKSDHESNHKSNQVFQSKFQNQRQSVVEQRYSLTDKKKLLKLVREVQYDLDKKYDFNNIRKQPFVQVKSKGKLIYQTKKLTIQTQFGHIQNKDVYFDALSKIAKKCEPDVSFSESQKNQTTKNQPLKNQMSISEISRHGISINQISRSEKSIKQEMMEEKSRLLQKHHKNHHNNNNNKKINKCKGQQRNNDGLYQRLEKDVSEQSFTYLLNKGNQDIQSGFKYKQQNIKALSAHQLQDSQNDQQIVGGYSNEDQCTSQNQSQDKGQDRSSKRQKYSYEESSGQSQLQNQNQLDVSLQIKDLQIGQKVTQMNENSSLSGPRITQMNENSSEENQLSQLTEMNFKIERIISDRIGKSEQIEAVKALVLSAKNKCQTTKKKPKSSTQLSLQTKQLCIRSNKLKSQLRQQNKQKISQSNTLIQNQTFKKSPLISPSAYAVQNKLKIIESLRKPRRSVEEQFQIAKTLSNKKLLEELKMFQNLQKDNEFSLIPDVHCSSYPNKQWLPQKQMSQRQQIFTKDNHEGKYAILQSWKHCQNFISLKLNDSDSQKIFIKSPSSPKQYFFSNGSWQFNKQTQQKQDSPLLNGFESSSNRATGFQNQIFDFQSSKFSKLESHSIKPFSEGPQIYTQPLKTNQKQNFEQEFRQAIDYDDSSLSLYHEKNVLELRKTQYSNFSLQFQKQMEDYLKDNSSVQNQSKSQSKQKQSANNSARSDQIFFYGKNLNSCDSKQFELSNQNLVQNFGKKTINSQDDEPLTAGGLDRLDIKKCQLISHLLNTLIGQFASFLNSNKSILHKFLYFVSVSHMVTLQDHQQAERTNAPFSNNHFNQKNADSEHRDERQINQQQFKEYLQTKIQASNHYSFRLAQDLLNFVKKSQEHQQELIRKINVSFGLKSLKTLKWMRKAFAENDSGEKEQQEQQQQQESCDSAMSQTEHIQAVLSPTLLADFDAHQNELVFEQINEQQYYLNHAIYASLNQICDTIRPYGQNGQPVIPKYNFLPSLCFSTLEIKILLRFQNLISLRMGRTTFSVDEEPQKIITQSYRKMDQMIVEEQNQKWTDRNLEDIVFESEYYLALQVVEVIFNQQILQIFRILYP